MLRAGELKRLWARSWSERCLLLEAVIWLGLMRLAIHWLRFKRIVGLLGMVQGGVSVVPDPTLADKAAGVSWAVQAAARRTPWESTCLVQALAGAVLLRRRGLPGTLYLGVADNTAKKIDAHAWLSCGDNILTGAKGHKWFTVISGFTMS